MKKPEAAASEPRQATSVDDVRRVRERLSAEFDGDVLKLGQHARRVGEEYRRQLGLKPAAEQ